MRNLVLSLRLVMAWILVSMGVAHASITLPVEPTVWVETPSVQAGKAPKGFNFNVQLFNLIGNTEGQITFEVIDANNQNKTGLSIPAVNIKATQPKTSVNVRANFVKEGWYTVKVKTKTKSFQRVNVMRFLYVEGEVFYDWEGSDLINSIVSHNLADNKQYNALKAKAEQLKANRAKSTPNAPFSDPAARLLDKSEQETLDKLKQDEKERVLKTIQQKTGVQKTSKAGPADPAAGEQVTVKVRWPTDATQTSFLPLVGAKYG